MFTYIAYFNMCIHCNGYFICVTTCIQYINFKYKWKLYAHPHYGKFLLPKALFVICYKPPQLVCEFMYISIFCDRQSQTQVYRNDGCAAIILFLQFGSIYFRLTATCPSTSKYTPNRSIVGGFFFPQRNSFNIFRELSLANRLRNSQR